MFPTEKYCLLNDQLMDAGQKLICKAVEDLESYQSVLNCQKQDESCVSQILWYVTTF